MNIKVYIILAILATCYATLLPLVLPFVQTNVGLEGKAYINKGPFAGQKDMGLEKKINFGFGGKDLFISKAFDALKYKNMAKIAESQPRQQVVINQINNNERPGGDNIYDVAFPGVQLDRNGRWRGEIVFVTTPDGNLIPRHVIRGSLHLTADGQGDFVYIINPQGVLTPLFIEPGQLEPIESWYGAVNIAVGPGGRMKQKNPIFTHLGINEKRPGEIVFVMNGKRLVPKRVISGHLQITIQGRGQLVYVVTPAGVLSPMYAARGQLAPIVLNPGGDIPRTCKPCNLRKRYY